MSIFRAYDIRGIYGQDLTEEVMLKLGKTLGTFLGGNKNVAVGYDTRISSKRLFDHFSKGLTSTGCNVINLGMVTTPMVYFYAWKNNTFGVSITASHNPKQWNGLKITRPSGISFINELAELEKIFKFGKFASGNGKMTKGSVIEIYRIFLKRKIGFIKKKIVVEFFGTVSVMALPILRDLGIDVVSLHEVPDGNFSGFERPDPQKPGNLKQLKVAVKENEADFGAAFDGDGDRAVFVDEKGNELNESLTMAIFIDNILRKKRGKVVVTHDSASGIEKIVDDLGGKMVWGQIGHGYMERRLVYERALFGGEQSGHISFNDFYPFSDGLLTILYLARLLTEDGEKLSKVAKRKAFSILNPVGKFYINVGTHENKVNAIKKLKKKYRDAQNVMGGIKINLNKAEWILMRPSANMPEINICIEAKNKKRLSQLKQKYTKIIKRI